MELKDLRELLHETLQGRGIDAWVFEHGAGADPQTILSTSIQEVETCDIFVGLFWAQFGHVTVEEYRQARRLGKPCLVYIRGEGLQREERLEEFLHSDVFDPRTGVL